MFHFWHNSMTLPQENLTEPALYAVAFPGKSSGIYSASPLSASECVEAKQGLGWSVTTVSSLTGTVAGELQEGSLSAQNEVLSLTVSPNTCETTGNPMGKIAGGTGSVAYTRMSLRGNDGRQREISVAGIDDLSFLASPKGASAMDASADHSALFLATTLRQSYQSGYAAFQG